MKLEAVVVSALTPVASALVPAPVGPLIVPASVPSAVPPVRLSLIIPTFNEAKNLPTLVAELEKRLDPVLGSAYELVVVDDDSPDLTWQVALDMIPEHPRIRVMRRQNERDLSTAVIRGWQVARGEILAVMDADLQHPPEVNLGLFEEIERGADLAVGSRHAPGGGLSDWSFVRRLLSRGAQLIGLLLLPGVLGRISDPMSGYFMLRRSAIGDIKLAPLGYKILIEVVARGKIRWIGEVGYVFRERSVGESKVTWKLYFNYLLHLLRLRWVTLPNSQFFRFCVVGGIGMMVDMTVLFLLSDPRSLGWGLTRSKLVAAETAILSNFLFNDFWTFRGIAPAGVMPRLRRFLGFNFICLAGVGINIVILNVLFNYAHMNRYAANALSIAAVAGWNYLLSRKVNWTATKVQGDPER